MNVTIVNLGQIVHPQDGLAARPCIPYVRNELEDQFQTGALIDQQYVRMLFANEIQCFTQTGGRANVLELLALCENFCQAFYDDRLCLTDEYTDFAHVMALRSVRSTVAIGQCRY